MAPTWHHFLLYFKIKFCCISIEMCISFNFVTKSYHALAASHEISQLTDSRILFRHFQVHVKIYYRFSTFIVTCVILFEFFTLNSSPPNYIVGLILYDHLGCVPRISMPMHSQLSCTCIKAARFNLGFVTLILHRGMENAITQF